MIGHASDAVIGFAALVVAAVLVLYPNAPSPRPKPEPAPPPLSEQVSQGAAPSSAATDTTTKREAEQKRVDQLARDVDAAHREIIEIKEAVRLQQALKTLPQESGGKP